MSSRTYYSAYKYEYTNPSVETEEWKKVKHPCGQVKESHSGGFSKDMKGSLVGAVMTSEAGNPLKLKPGEAYLALGEIVKVLNGVATIAFKGTEGKKMEFKDRSQVFFKYDPRDRLNAIGPSFTVGDETRTFSDSESSEGSSDSSDDDESPVATPKKTPTESNCGKPNIPEKSTTECIHTHEPDSRSVVSATKIGGKRVTTKRKVAAKRKAKTDDEEFEDAVDTSDSDESYSHPKPKQKRARAATERGAYRMLHVAYAYIYEKTATNHFRRNNHPCGAKKETARKEFSSKTDVKKPIWAVYTNDGRFENIPEDATFIALGEILEVLDNGTARVHFKMDDPDQIEEFEDTKDVYFEFEPNKQKLEPLGRRKKVMNSLLDGDLVTLTPEKERALKEDIAFLKGRIDEISAQIKKDKSIAENVKAQMQKLQEKRTKNIAITENEIEVLNQAMTELVDANIRKERQKLIDKRLKDLEKSVAKERKRAELEKKEEQKQEPYKPPDDNADVASVVIARYWNAKPVDERDEQIKVCIAEMKSLLEEKAAGKLNMEDAETRAKIKYAMTFCM